MNALKNLWHRLTKAPDLMERVARDLSNAQHMLLDAEADMEVAQANRDTCKQRVERLTKELNKLSRKAD